MSRGILTILIGLSLGGCMDLGPHYGCQEPRLLCDWQNSMDACVTDHAPQHASWWEDFQDPVLNCLIHAAYEQSLELEVACARIQEARAELGIATGMIYPQAQRVFGKHIRGRLSEQVPPVSILPPDIKDDVNFNNNFLTLSFDVAWELDIWGRFRKGVQAATQNYCASVAAYDGALVLLFSQLAESYITFRHFQELESLLADHLSLQHRSFEIADVRFKNGLVSELDVAEAQRELLSVQSQVPAVMEAQIHAKNALCLLLALAPGELDELLCEGHQLPQPTSCVAVGLPADLLRSRPDVREAEHRAMSACARVGVAKTALYPHFGLVGTVGFAATKGRNLFRSDSIYWNWGPIIDWDVLNYGRLKNAVCLEDAVFKQALLAYKEKVLQAQAEVEDAMASVASSLEQGTTLNRSVVAAERAYHLSLTQYREGETELDRLLMSQRVLLGQRQAELEAKVHHLKSLIHLYKGLGGGWQWRLEDEGEEI